MSDTETKPKAPKANVDRVIIRSWPKMILMLPTLFMALVCGVLTAVYGEPAADAPFSLVHLAGLLFLLVLLVNLTVLLYDMSLRGFLVLGLFILVVILGLVVIDMQRQGGVWEALGRALSIRVFANAPFYFLLSLVLFVDLVIAWIITRFHYWVVENNEIIIHKGFMQEQERHPTAQARFKLLIEDVAEYALLGSGKLVFFFGDDRTEHELPTVLFIRRKAKALDELLGRVAIIDRP